jgi:hypothetical protein
MPSIGYTSPINGSNVAFSIFAKNPANPGGAIRGYMPQTTENVDKRYKEFEQIRYTLKNAWNTNYNHLPNKQQSICTPFRAVNNAGDLLSRQYYSCGGPCQTFQSRPGLFGLKNSFGHIQNLCDGSNVPPASCNIKYVYDSSDYSTYLKQKALNKNYNDSSYGGNRSSTSQSYIRAIRRY